MFRSVLVWLLLGLTVPAMADSGLRYSGSSTVGTGVLSAAARKAFTAKTEVSFSSFSQPGSNTGIKDLLAGKADVAGCSRALSAKEKAEGLLGSVIGYDAIVLVVHRGNPVETLSQQQLAAIFSGATSDWSAVTSGRFKGAISLAGLAPSHGTAKLFSEVAIDNRPPSKTMHTFNDHDGVLEYVAWHRKAIGFASLGFVQNSPLADKIKLLQINKVPANEVTIRGGSYLLARPLLLVTKGLPTSDAAKLVGYLLGPEGQTRVAREFIPLTHQ